MKTSKTTDIDFEERVSATEVYLEVARQKIEIAQQKIEDQGKGLDELRQRQAAFEGLVELLCEMILTQIGIKNAQQTVKEFLKR